MNISQILRTCWTQLYVIKSVTTLFSSCEKCGVGVGVVRILGFETPSAYLSAPFPSYSTESISCSVVMFTLYLIWLFSSILPLPLPHSKVDGRILDHRTSATILCEEGGSTSQMLKRSLKRKYYKDQVVNRHLLKPVRNYVELLKFLGKVRKK